jgi:hypothetical protein
MRLLTLVKLIHLAAAGLFGSIALTVLFRFFPNTRTPLLVGLLFVMLMGIFGTAGDSPLAQVLRTDVALLRAALVAMAVVGLVGAGIGIWLI